MCVGGGGWWGGGFWRKAKRFSHAERIRLKQTQVVHISMVTRDRAIGASPVRQQEKGEPGLGSPPTAPRRARPRPEPGSRQQCPADFFFRPSPPLCYKEMSGATFCFTIWRTTFALLFHFFFAVSILLVSWSLCRDG